ncbi:hypothetical protein NQ314_019024 [Rhamnusium bicolor]|uniref:Uncharacterized protein n=1 Tax=Rhamnusium bicolor TaxID=1586634 RepID=A0AAV8WNS5_9CUCU|nr:hypothetical protein NQ314_019024 [Rhamnusium bicolor]
MVKEEEDDDCILLQLVTKKRKMEDLYKRRNVEGYSHVLIENHVINDEETFRNFFRLNRRQFNFVLSCIGTKIKKLASRRVNKPISVEQKLYVTLR